MCYPQIHARPEAQNATPLRNRTLADVISEGEEAVECGGREPNNWPVLTGRPREHGTETHRAGCQVKMEMTRVMLAVSD